MRNNMLGTVWMVPERSRGVRERVLDLVSGEQRRSKLGVGFCSEFGHVCAWNRGRTDSIEMQIRE